MGEVFVGCGPHDDLRGSGLVSSCSGATEDMTMSELPFDPKATFSHEPVLLESVISALDAAQGGLFVDATAGGAGHCRAILSASPSVRLIATDRDLTAVDTARERLAEFG